MDRNKYKSISNLKELHSAREELKGAIALKEFELKGEFAACKQALNPVTYINRLITKLYTMENIIGLKLVVSCKNSKRTAVCRWNVIKKVVPFIYV